MQVRLHSGFNWLCLYEADSGTLKTYIDQYIKRENKVVQKDGFDLWTP